MLLYLCQCLPNSCTRGRNRFWCVFNFNGKKVQGKWRCVTRYSDSGILSEWITFLWCKESTTDVLSFSISLLLLLELGRSFLQGTVLGTAEEIHHKVHSVSEKEWVQDTPHPCSGQILSITGWAAIHRGGRCRPQCDITALQCSPSFLTCKLG